MNCRDQKQVSYYLCKVIMALNTPSYGGDLYERWPHRRASIPGEKQEDVKRSLQSAVQSALDGTPGSDLVNWAPMTFTAPGRGVVLNLSTKSPFVAQEATRFDRSLSDLDITKRNIYLQCYRFKDSLNPPPGFVQTPIAGLSNDEIHHLFDLLTEYKKSASAPPQCKVEGKAGGVACMLKGRDEAKFLCFFGSTSQKYAFQI